MYGSIKITLSGGTLGLLMWNVHGYRRQQDSVHSSVTPETAFEVHQLHPGN